MRFVLVALTLNHFIYLYFEHFIDGVMSNPSEVGQAPGYGLFIVNISLSDFSRTSIYYRFALPNFSSASMEREHMVLVSFFINVASDSRC